MPDLSLTIDLPEDSIVEQDQEKLDALMKRLESDFSYHKPAGPAQTEAYVAIRAVAQSLAMTIAMLVPDGRERSLAFTKIEEAVMWANAGRARSGK